MEINKRIRDLVRHLSAGMHEREEIVAVSLLGALSGQNTFLYGPPGTAKSLISRRIACGFQDPTYFECLMNRFSTPEEVFGPVSIKELKEDRYVRKSAGYLPTAEFAFLDEIWKSSPAILNALLTLINERTFRNGERVEKAPLKALIAASNETPDVNQGLDALYDRFIVRLMVPPINDSDHFNKLLDSPPAQAAISVPTELKVERAEWELWREEIQSSVSLSKETLTIVHLVRRALEEKREALKIYVSDRRWQRSAMLMKAAAYFSGRLETNHSDALLLQHCLWTTDENREAVTDLVFKAVREAGFEGDIDLAALDRAKDACDLEIRQELYHSEDLYETVEYAGKAYFEFVMEYENRWDGAEERVILIPAEKLKSLIEFSPINHQGVALNDVTCKFDGQGVCVVTTQGRRSGHKIDFEFQPNILFARGDKKVGVNHRLIQALSKQVCDIKVRLEEVREKSQIHADLYRKSMASVFVPEKKTELAYGGVLEQIQRLDLRILDCERLQGLCQ